jgi:excisionase family DNA binding protein
MTAVDPSQLERSAMTEAKSDYMKVQEVADLFHVSSKTVVRWANDGKLPHMVTMGGHRRFPRIALEKVRAGLEVETANS